MAVILNLDQIKEALKKIDPVDGIIPMIAEGFIAYSRGQVVVPPVGELVSVLLDEGYLTQVRTAAAGAVDLTGVAVQDIQITKAVWNVAAAAQTEV